MLCGIQSPFQHSELGILMRKNATIYGTAVFASIHEALIFVHVLNFSVSVPQFRPKYRTVARVPGIAD
eukprot:COSAG02_NODE_12365_length_1557_cov_3.104938_1_plen_67_part_10